MVTYNAPTRVSSIAIEISGTSDQVAPVPFRIYVDGDKVADYSSPTQAFRRVITIPIGESPLIEVLDKAAAIPSPAFPGHITLNWLAVPSATYYTVEEYIAAVWTVVATVQTESRTAFRWRTRLLEASASHQFRVTPFNSSGTSATPLTYSFLCVRHADVPNVEYTYSGITHKVTISDAS